jgi:hypothetical protein
VKKQPQTSFFLALALQFQQRLETVTETMIEWDAFVAECKFRVPRLRVTRQRRRHPRVMVKSGAFAAGG